MREGQFTEQRLAAALRQAENADATGHRIDRYRLPQRADRKGRRAAASRWPA